MKKENKWVIFSSYDRYDEDVLNAIREDFADGTDMSPEDLSEEFVYDIFWENLNDERGNLNKEVDGVIIALASVGTWHGTFPGYKIYGSNIKKILFSNEDDMEWYADRYNIRMRSSNHDASSSCVYRVAKDYETAEHLANKIYNGEMDEKQFFARTKSLRPYVADVYGWTN